MGLIEVKLCASFLLDRFLTLPYLLDLDLLMLKAAFAEEVRGGSEEGVLPCIA